MRFEVLGRLRAMAPVEAGGGPPSATGEAGGGPPSATGERPLGGPNTSDHQYVQAEAIGVDEVRLDLLRNDPSTQVLEENHVTISASGIRFNPVVQRYAWPAELDLMARIAGLRCIERWGGWSGEPFTKHSVLAVSAWGR